MKYYKQEDYYAAYSSGSHVYEFYISTYVPCLWAGYGHVDFVLEGCTEISAEEFLSALDTALRNQNGICK